MGERRIGIIDRLVLADQAAQLRREAAGARLELWIAHHFAGLDGQWGERRHDSGEGQREDDEAGFHGAPARATSADFARAGAPILKRRSASESAPPNAITQAPIQIKVTSGFQ